LTNGIVSCILYIIKIKKGEIDLIKIKVDKVIMRNPLTSGNGKLCLARLDQNRDVFVVGENIMAWDSVEQTINPDTREKIFTHKKNVLKGFIDDTKAAFKYFDSLSTELCKNTQKKSRPWTPKTIVKSLKNTVDNKMRPLLGFSTSDIFGCGEGSMIDCDECKDKSLCDWFEIIKCNIIDESNKDNPANFESEYYI
jgi:hypothetical protein